MDPKTSYKDPQPLYTAVNVPTLPDSIEGMLLTPLGVVIDAMNASGANSWRYTDKLPTGQAMTVMIVTGDAGALALQRLGQQLMESATVPGALS